ncbi:dual specificity phosphatase, catalytic domain-containing protein [Ditylenchus destructor]|uniref:protein-tyrosine-phosphatase n=1 Tax=Ditylenchus destructor TaxID=166010 RepID=A0AAD4N5T9_9BILA|nr:dual specificity phosphatase, catalytic domain-containing protein [Ditylenchus destructor]
MIDQTLVITFICTSGCFYSRTTSPGPCLDTSSNDVAASALVVAGLRGWLNGVTSVRSLIRSLKNVFSLLRLSAPVRLLLISRLVFLLLSETNCKGSKQEQSAMKMEQNSLAARRKFLGDPFSLTIMPTMDLIGDENGQRGIPVDNCRRHPRPSVLFPVRILPHLYLGNDETAKNLNTLKRSNIRYVINVTPNLPNYFAGEPDFHYLRIPVDDSCSPNLAQFFPEAISFIEKAREEHSSVLVHCWAGISRSVTVCLAYLMYALHSTLEDAFDLLLKQNGTIAPNFHFMETLTCWERQLFDRTAGFSSASTSTVTSSASSSTVSSASAICSPPESTFSIGSQEMLAHGEPRPDGSEWTCPSSPNERPSSATSPKSENFTSKRVLHASESSPPADSLFIRK